MALLTAQGISSVAAELLSRSLVLPNTVTRIPGGEFAGANGDTITVRVPQAGSAREQTVPGATITYDDTSETAVDVTLRHLYHGKRITDEELSFTLEDFARQITRVQVDAVARGAEDILAEAMNDLAADDSFAATATDADTIATVMAARSALGAANVPPGDRFLAVSSDIAARLLTLDVMIRADASGSTSALREANIGRMFGFTVVESNALDAGTAVAYHRTGFAFANRVPVIPRGASESATATVGGVGLRHIFQYQPDILSDASVVSTFAGAAAVWEDGATATDNKRFYKMNTAAA